MEEALFLTRFATRVTIVHRTSNLSQAPTLSYSVYIVEKGKPRSIPANPPAGMN